MIYFIQPREGTGMGTKSATVAIAVAKPTYGEGPGHLGVLYDMEQGPGKHGC